LLPYKSLKDASPLWKSLDGCSLTLLQVNWVANVYDGLVSSGKSKNSAAAIAISNFKKSHKKEGDKWVKKENENVERIRINLKEAEFSETEKKAKVTIIKQGWSKNKTNGKQRYYTKEAIGSIVEALNNLPDSRKMYSNHSDRDRNNEEWAATVESAWEENGNARAEITFTENPNTVWLYQEAKKHPEQVGISISGRGKWKEGTVEGKPATVIMKVLEFDSADFVTRPAAGGRVDIAESFMQDRIDEALETIKQRVEDRKKRNMPYIEMDWLLDSVIGFVMDLMYSNDGTDDDIAQMVKEFEEKLKEIIKKIKVKENNMDLKQFKTDNPDVYESIVEQVTLLAENEASKKVQETVDKKDKDLQERTKEIDSLKAEIVTTKEEVTKLKTELDNYKEKEKIQAKKDLIAKKLAEAELKEPSEMFLELLNDAKDEAGMDKLIKEKLETIKSIKEKETISLPKNHDVKGKEVKILTEEEEKRILGLL